MSRNLFLRYLPCRLCTLRDHSEFIIVGTISPDYQFIWVNVSLETSLEVH